MARETLAERRKKLSINSDEPGEPEAGPLSAEEEEYEQFLTEIGAAPGDAVVHVHKLNVEGKDVRIWKGAPGQFDLELLAKKFGSGDYRVMLYSRVDSGQIVRRSNHIIPMLLSAEEDARIRALRDGRAMDQGSNGFTLEMLTAAIKAAIPQPQVNVAAQNPLGLIKEVGEIVRSLQPQAPAASQNVSAADLLGIVVAMLKDRAGGGNDDDEPIRRGANAGGMDLLMRLVDKFADPLKAAMQGNAVQQNGAAAQALPSPAVAAATQSGAESAVPPGGDDMSRLKAGLAFLVMQATRGADAELYADVILDNVPEDELRPLIENPAWLDTLAVFDPGVKKHAKWFENLKAAVAAELNASESDDKAAS